MNDVRLHYKLWKEKLSSLQAQHARDDSDLALASELWATPDENVLWLLNAIGEA